MHSTENPLSETVSTGYAMQCTGNSQAIPGGLTTAAAFEVGWKNFKSKYKDNPLRPIGLRGCRGVLRAQNRCTERS